MLFTNTIVSATPLIIAHRAGTADAPENTVPAITLALNHHADIIWVSVQLSKDNIPVLYHPNDLATLTNSNGPVSAKTAYELTSINAGWRFSKEEGGHKVYPWRDQPIPIPTLMDVLIEFPETRFFLDLKSPDAEPRQFAQAIQQVLLQTDSYSRVRVYSTSKVFTDSLASYPKIKTFVARDITRAILVHSRLGGNCVAGKYQPGWHGIELHRPIEIIEHFTLGEGVTPATLSWDKDAMACFHSQPSNHIVFFGVNSLSALDMAGKLGAHAVMVDSPAQFQHEH